MKLGVCQFGGYYDDIVNDLLQVDGVNESVLHIVAIGLSVNNNVNIDSGQNKK